MKQLLKAFCLLISIPLLACQQNKNKSINQTAPINQKEAAATTKQFSDYWYNGKAELNSYELKQSRYGEMRDGEVVLVFVTEPFSISKQVKLDNPDDAGKDNISVMKLNNIRKFNTGIYDYSVLSSTFTPIDFYNYPNTLKSNMSIQEWCGQTYTQLNLKGKNYQYQQFSYFESEGDIEKNIPKAMLEDELMTRIRINNGQLPLGEIDIIFSTLYSRLAHKELKVNKAKISKTESETVINYTINYPSIERKITIDVEKAFPYKILSFTEDDGSGLITEAKLKKTLIEPYWNQNSVVDEAKRKELQLMK
ncbi:hypothetical protein [Pedobacter alpinus]|uniref:Septum formation inhibitor Maf n=1 Tax=Pedobacter alpinus TaxID=1590643 RepID=A0ABW5TV10_9SPHI